MGDGHKGLGLCSGSRTDITRPFLEAKIRYGRKGCIPYPSQNPIESAAVKLEH